MLLMVKYFSATIDVNRNSFHLPSTPTPPDSHPYSIPTFSVLIIPTASGTISTAPNLFQGGSLKPRECPIGISYLVIDTVFDIELLTPSLSVTVRVTE